MRNKNKQILNFPEETIVPFEIPQIVKPPKNIKTKDTKFVASHALSAIFGSNNFDESYAPPAETIDYKDGRALDPFRKPEDRKTPDDNREFETIIIRNEDRTKLFPGSRPLPGTNIELPKEEIKRPTKRVYKEEKKEEVPSFNENYKEEADNEDYSFNVNPEEMFDAPVFIDVDDEPKKEEVSIPVLPIDDEMESFRPADIDEEEFYEEDEENVEVKPFVKQEVEEIEVPYEEPQAYKSTPKVEKPKPKKVSYKNYKLPPLSIFKEIETDSNIAHEWITDQLDIINRTLQEFSIDGTVVNYTKGPSVTRYEISLAPGVSVKKVSQIEENLKMNLAAKSLHIEAPIPGKTYVGVEVPNKVVDTVNFGNICHSKEFAEASKLSFGVGIDLNGSIVCTPINKMPHGLIAGTTGSGKSVCSHSLIISLLLKNKPDELKILLVDPKAVEFVFYEDLPHLITPIITDPKLASQALKWCCDEMDNRYKLFANLKVRNIEDYNKKIESDYPEENKMPYILIIIDELADLMQTASSDVEQSIQRITQKARAAGMHLIVATQRPTTDVVKGTIKANIPTRIAFRVSSPMDSMTILDYGGAEQLLGRGDMFFKNEFATTRIQGAYIQDDEINAVCDYIRAQAGPDYVFNHESLTQSIDAQARKEATDELFEAVAMYVVEMQNASINNLTKRFGIGFNRAQSLIELLESSGIVSPQTPGKARQVFVKSVEELEEILK